MKTNELNKNDKCFACSHLGYCQIYWGTECKRQGGRKTPRLISKKQLNLMTPELENVQKLIRKKNFVKPKLEISQPILTKRVNWGSYG
jgi:hypothetical protein